MTINWTSVDPLIARVERVMQQVVDDAARDAASTFQPGDLPIYDVIRYHLGWVDETFARETGDSGKRVRPLVCLLSAGAAGIDPDEALPIAAGIELLHNFTLLHDDIQDRSAFRRGRPTVWSLWGESQAINAGDATFALSQLALLRLSRERVPPETTATLIGAFNRMTLRIVEGQVLDLGFEDRWDITAADYLRMIDGKTAAVVAFATWAAARLAGQNASECDRYHAFGRLLGIGFQIRDDYLGIWGTQEQTGKTQGDDLRGRKKSLPILMLLERTSDTEISWIRQLYTDGELSEADIGLMMELLDRYEIGREIETITTDYHDRALAALDGVVAQSPYRESLVELAEQLVDRSR